MVLFYTMCPDVPLKLEGGVGVLPGTSGTPSFASIACWTAMRIALGDLAGATYESATCVGRGLANTVSY